MHERLKELRKTLGLSQDAFGERIGLSGGAISLLEKAKRNFTEQVIKAICREFSVNEEWLRSGTGDPHIPVEDEFSAYVEDLLSDDKNPLYDIIRGIIKTYHGLDEKSKETFKKFSAELRDTMKRG